MRGGQRRFHNWRAERLWWIYSAEHHPLVSMTHGLHFRNMAVHQVRSPAAHLWLVWEWRWRTPFVEWSCAWELGWWRTQYSHRSLLFEVDELHRWWDTLLLDMELWLSRRFFLAFVFIVWMVIVDSALLHSGLACKLTGASYRGNRFAFPDTLEINEDTSHYHHYQG